MIRRRRDSLEAEDNVINIEQQVRNLSVMMIDEQISI